MAWYDRFLGIDREEKENPSQYLISRDEGIALIKKYDHEYPKKYLKDILEYLSISEQTFWDVIDRHQNREIFTKDSSGNWKFKIAIE